MKKHHLPITLLTTLFIAGCSSTGDGSFLNALNQFSNILDGAMPLTQESEEWEQYSIEKAKQGVVYSEATAADTKYVKHKFETEYPKAIDRLSRPFALTKDAVRKLEESNQGYHFTFNKIMAVKNRSNSNTIGYCINFDVNRWENGKPTELDAAGNVQKQFIYAAKDKPLSTMAVKESFIKRLCGDNFYNQYKDPKA